MEINMKFGIDMSLKQALMFEESRAVLETHMPDVVKMAGSQPMAMNLSIRKLAQYTGLIDSVKLQTIDEGLQKINENGPVISAEEAEKIVRYKEIAQQAAKRPRPARGEKQNAIYPGRPWIDTCGNRIQAHGGAVFYENGTYYWYGENKEFTDGKNGIWTWGIRAYASQDLYNWEDLGLIIEPDLEDPDADLFPDKHIDRPHILKCGRTGKYVCWIKLSGNESHFLVLQADAFTGPYEVVREAYLPFGMQVGDFDMIQSEGRAYLFMDGDHEAVFGIRLSDDFLTAQEIVSRQYEGLQPPFSREGITLFERGEKKYLLTSGMTGYVPNASDLAVSDSWENAFVSIGDPHVRDETQASFNSQVSQVFKLEGKELYVSVADRWLPDYPMDAARVDMMKRAILAGKEPDKYRITPEEKTEFLKYQTLEKINTSVSDYVWLPVRFEGDKALIEWKDEWRVEDYG